MDDSVDLMTIVEKYDKKVKDTRDEIRKDFEREVSFFKAEIDSYKKLIAFVFACLFFLGTAAGVMGYRSILAEVAKHAETNLDAKATVLVNAAVAKRFTDKKINDLTVAMASQQTVKMVGAQVSQLILRNAFEGAVLGPFNKMICTPGVFSPGCDIKADSIQSPVINVPEGQKILTAWYVPVANLGDLSAFGAIIVSIGSKNTIDVTATMAGREGKMRVFIYAICSPETLPGKV